jgi:hypothetical protein
MLLFLLNLQPIAIDKSQPGAIANGGGANRIHVKPFNGLAHHENLAARRLFIAEITGSVSTAQTQSSQASGLLGHFGYATTTQDFEGNASGVVDNRTLGNRKKAQQLAALLLLAT